MLKDVTLGQYFPGETSVHKLDPRTKLVLVIVYIVALFLAKGVASYALVAACLLAVIWTSKIHLKVIVKSLKPLLLIIVLTALLNLFTGRESRWCSSGFSKLRSRASKTPFLWSCALRFWWRARSCSPIPQAPLR